jgi:crotonobetainyl-CoA:carnitine CoA-transferase CaiB-like acyl-CoA transferase
VGHSPEGVTAPLAGLRVIEVGGYVTAPFASVLLAQLGAETIKVEQPRGGDPFRKWSEGGAASPTFTGMNHNKKSVALDIHDPAGKDLFRRLVAGSDVLIENLRPGALERQELGFDDLVELNPQLVYCSISGFGDSGPYRGRPGYDTLGQAMSGLLSLLTDLEDPQPMGTSLSDHVTGVFGALAVLTGLHQRNATGRGCRVATSLLESTVALLAESSGRYFSTGKVPSQRHRARLAQVYCFVAGDGKPFVVHLSSPEKFWEGLTTAIQKPEFRDDERFATAAARRSHYDVLLQELDKVFSAGPRHQWLEVLAAHDVPSGPINTLDEVFADPQIQHLGMAVAGRSHEDAAAVRHVATPVRVDGVRNSPSQPPPALGQHTRVVLADLGIDDTELEELRLQGIVAWNETPLS